MPLVALATARDDNVAKVDPVLANQLRPLVVAKDRDLQLVVVGGVVDDEAQFLVPVNMRSAEPFQVPSPRVSTYHFGVCPPRMSVTVFLASLPRRAAQ